MMMWQAVQTSARSDTLSRLPSRIDNWDRDTTARAFALARWEDDGGLVGGVRIGPEHPLSTNGRMAPQGNRDI